MSKKKPIKGRKTAWRIRGTDGEWKDLGDNPPKSLFPGYLWTPGIPEKDGVRVLTFIMN